jgi:superfamily II DNA or RNA helicase
MDKLFEYQQVHCRILIESINKHGRALDCSITGAGKTYCSIALCKELGLKPFIICPKSMIQTWCNIMKKDFNIDFYGIINYESFVNGIYYNKSLKKVINPLLHITTEQQYTQSKSKIIKTIDWIEDKIPDDMIFIFDEAHRCKNHNSKNGIILSKLSLTNAKILLISATIIDKDIYVKILVDVFRLNEYEYSPKRGILTDTQLMSKLHTILFPEYGNRMRYDDVKEKFKRNHVLIDVEEMINATEIQKNYIYLKQAIKNIKKKMRKTSGLGTIIRTLQKIEILKVPKFVEIAEEAIRDNKSVVVFFNYNASIYHFCDNLSFKTDCIIFGEQSQETRLKNIEKFNSGASKIIICNIKAGGVSISLHDTLGLNQRVSLISPTWSAQDLIQCLGRIHRANAKSDAIQRIIFAKDTDEEVVSKAISRKIENIGLLNDNSRLSYEFITNIDEFNELLELYNETDIMTNSVDNIIDKELDDELSDSS